MRVFTKIFAFFMRIALAVTGWIGCFPQPTLKVNRYDTHQTNEGFGTSAEKKCEAVGDGTFTGSFTFEPESVTTLILR